MAQSYRFATAAAVALASVLVFADVLPEPETIHWVIPSGNPPAGTTEPGNGVILEVNKGAHLKFEWSTGNHDLKQMAGEAELNACDFTGATELVERGSTGEFDVTPEVGTFYYSCSTQGHC